MTTSSQSFPIRLYDTASRAKVDFRPLDDTNVRMYVCGPTVYDFAHIGNARPLIVFDVLYRLLRHRYGAEHVTYVRNVTDVDDKINRRAHERGISIRELTDGTLAQFHADVDALGCLRPTVEPRATDYIEEMKAIIERLVAKGVAYVAEDHVLFSVAAMERLPGVPRYGSLSRRPLDDMIAGARVDVAPYKRDPMDFVLWKPSREAHEPGWPSPCGIAPPGRPGWHIECSAMAWKELVARFAPTPRCDVPEDQMFDIHGGGIDLVFPHHENEIAQSCCAFDLPRMAQVWMHNGFLQVEGEKMSKSLGNFVTIRELLNDWPGEVVRLTMLKTHYREPIDWTIRSIEESWATLKRWYEHAAPQSAPDPAVVDALADDLNTPLAIAHLHQAKDVDRQMGRAAALSLMGFSNDPAALSDPRPIKLAVERSWIELQINNRLAARKAKNWAESDRIRDELAAMGVSLKDGKDPATGEPVTTWEVTR